MVNPVSEEPEIPQHLREAFQRAVEQEGKPFQYAVLNRARELAEENRSSWVFIVSEFPVEVRGATTHIDFILQHHGRDRPNRILVAECKRANAALKNWLFLRAPFVKRNQERPEILIEGVLRGQDATTSTTAVQRPDFTSDRVYHIALEAKGTERGSASGRGRGAIEEAAGQVMRGLNGLVEFLSEHPDAATRHFMPSSNYVELVPAIFTTAPLWTCSVDLSSTDLVSGELSLADVNAKPAPWVWYQYHVTPSLRHHLPVTIGKRDGLGNALDLGERLELEYARSIAVVNTAGIEDFLTKGPWGFS